MPTQPAFLNDKLEALVRKCVVFPADGSETCIVHMVARTATKDDASSLKSYRCCVDIPSVFSDNCRKTQVMVHRSARDGIQHTYLFFYNLSPNLPINLNVARVIGVNPSHLKTRRQLFWRGDVVAMKVQPESEHIDFIVKSWDADLLDLKSLEEFLQEKYQEGALGCLLRLKERQWEFYISLSCGPASLILGAPKSYWGLNATKKEENFLHDLNELRSVVGRPPLPPHVYMKSFTEHTMTLFAALKAAVCLPREVTGVPKLPPELERQIFEMCALDTPDICTVLVLVARRVYSWIDPILIATVCIMKYLEPMRRNRLKQFLIKLTNGKPVEYYGQHIKNLAILGGFCESGDINRILAVCTGVESLMLLIPTWGFDLFENPLAGRNLRRLTVKLRHFKSPRKSVSIPNFYHPCFVNLTHLHLTDDDEDWSLYAGWETLISLTHLAFACSGPPETTLQLIQKLPTVKYVALGHYVDGERYKYANAMVNNSPHTRAAWGVRVVFLSEIPQYDWERGARGEGDIWDLVEQEVERRIKEGSVN